MYSYRHKIVGFLFTIALLTSCATFEVRPETPTENVAFYRTVLTGVTTTAAEYTEQKLITLSTAIEIEKRLSQIEIMIDAYEASISTGSTDNTLAVTINRLLIELNNELLARGK